MQDFCRKLTKRRAGLSGLARACYLVGQLFFLNAPQWLSVGYRPSDPGRPVYYPATYRDIRLEKGQRYQRQDHSRVQQTWPAETNTTPTNLAHCLIMFHHPDLADLKPTYRFYFPTFL